MIAMQCSLWLCIQTVYLFGLLVASHEFFAFAPCLVFAVDDERSVPLLLFWPKVRPPHLLSHDVLRLHRHRHSWLLQWLGAEVFPMLCKTRFKAEEESRWQHQATTHTGRCVYTSYTHDFFTKYTWHAFHDHAMLRCMFKFHWKRKSSSWQKSALQGGTLEKFHSEEGFGLDHRDS